MSKNLHLEFIDPEQKYALTKIASKEANNQSFANGFIIKGFPIVGSDGTNSWIVVSAFKEAFQTSALLKVEYKPDHILLETLNSIYELKPVDGLALSER